MQDFDRINSYIRSLIKDEEGLLFEIYKTAVANDVPVIRPEAGEFIRTQLILKQPAHILEIGTAVGYSSLFMNSIIPDADITTMELDEERIKQAKANIEAMGKTEAIHILCGDAYELLKTLKADSYDFVFVDAAKAQYIKYLPDVKRVSKKGAVIITDNVLKEGEVLESHYLVEKRNRTIHDRMREYLYQITHDAELTTAVLSVGDGMAISVKN